MKKFNNYNDVDAIDSFIKEIDSCVKNRNYIAALHLALSIPDIMGKATFEKLKIKERYIKWFDENVRSARFGYLLSEHLGEKEDFPKMNGAVCYELRCRFFHEGKDDISSKTPINEFVLSMDDLGFVRGNYAGYDYDYDICDIDNCEVKEIRYLYVSCRGLCEDLITSAKTFKKNNPNLNYPKLRINNNGGKPTIPLFIVE